MRKHNASKHRKRLAAAAAVTGTVIVSPALAALAVGKLKVSNNFVAKQSSIFLVSLANDHDLEICLQYLALSFG